MKMVYGRCFARHHDGSRQLRRCGVGFERLVSHVPERPIRFGCCVSAGGSPTRLEKVGTPTARNRDQISRVAM